MKVERKVRSFPDTPPQSWLVLSALGTPYNRPSCPPAGSNEEIKCFARDKFSVDFPLMCKIDVNGPNESPLYTFLKEKTNGEPIHWNFTKFLVDREGNVKQRFEPKQSPEEIAAEIEKIVQ